MMFSILLGLMACKSDVSFEGTLVGNPGRGVTRVAEGENIQFTHASGRVATIEYQAANDGTDDVSIETQETDIAVDLLSASSVVPLLPGDWTRIQLNFDASTTFKGQRGLGGSFQLEMNEVVVSLSHDTVFSIEEGAGYVIELGEPGWLRDQDFEAEEGEDVILTAGDQILENLEDHINNYSGIYIDENEDGDLSEDERETGLVAHGEERSDHLSSDVDDPGDSEGSQ